MFLRRTASACQETDVYSMGHAAAKWRTVVVLHDCVFTCQMSLAFLGAVAFSTPLTPGVPSRVATGRIDETASLVRVTSCHAPVGPKLG